MQHLSRFGTHQGSQMKREYTNSEVEKAISELIHNAKHRDILRDRLIDGLTYEELAEKHHYSVTHIKTIVYKGEARIFS